MEKYLLANDTYGNTELRVENGMIHFTELFGVEMETKGYQPPRMLGLLDVYTSFGEIYFNQQLKSIEQKGNELIVVMSLYDGKMESVTSFNHDEKLGFIKRTDILRNLTDETVNLMKAKQRFNLADDDYDIFFQKSEWGTEVNGKWYPLTAAGLSIGCVGGRTCEGHTPMLAIQNREGRGFCIHLLPKGNWEMSIRMQSRQNVEQEFQYLLETGDSSDHFCYKIGAGKEYEFPELWLYSMAKGLLGMQANLQRYFLQYDQARFHMDPVHPLVYDSWLDRRDCFDLEHIKKTVVSAKELGAEVFVIDAGWFGNCEYDKTIEGENWFQQVGDWSEKKDGAFYGNVKGFADFVRENGMKFGMWIEPERFGLLVPIVKEHPEWFANGYNGSRFLFQKLWMPEVKQYLLNTLDEFINKYPLDWVTIDFNFELEEDPSGCSLHTYYDAWYSVWEELRTRHPQCGFELVSSGGLRTDIRAGMHSDSCLLSDDANDVDTERMFEQYALRLPAYKCQKYFAVKPGPKVFDCATRTMKDSICVPDHGDDMSVMNVCRSLDFVGPIYMSSNMALVGNLLDLNLEQREKMKMYVGLWKKYRDLYMNSILLLGHEPKTSGDQHGLQHIQYLNESTGDGLAFIFKYASPREEYRMHLRELKYEDVYHLTDEISGEDFGEYTGKELVLYGISIPIPRNVYVARMIAVKKVK